MRVRSVILILAVAMAAFAAGAIVFRSGNSPTVRRTLFEAAIEHIDPESGAISIRVSDATYISSGVTFDAPVARVMHGVLIVHLHADEELIAIVQAEVNPPGDGYGVVVARQEVHLAPASPVVVCLELGSRRAESVLVF